MRRLFIFFLSFWVMFSTASCTKQAVQPNQLTNESVATTNMSTLGTTTSTGIIEIEETTEKRTFTSETDNGIRIDVTVYGYSDKTNGFYAKSNEFIPVDVKVTNNSGSSIYRLNSSYVHGNLSAQTIELDLKIKENKNHSLTLSSHGFLYPSMVLLWNIDDGESYEWALRLAAGEVSFDQKYTGAMLETDGHEGGVVGIKLYGEEVFSNEICDFSGEITFCFSKTDNGYLTLNDQNVTVNVVIPILYQE